MYKPIAAVVLSLTFAASAAVAQRPFRPPVEPPLFPAPIVVPTPEYRVESVALDATIRDQVAQVSVTHVFRNPTNREIEAVYLFPLPESGAVQEMVLMVDGQEWPGRILPKDEARAIYESIVRRRRDPALLEYMGRGLFRASVFPIPPGGSRTVSLRSVFVCRRDEGVIEFGFPLVAHDQTARPIERLSVTVDVHTDADMKAVYSPSHPIVTERIGNRHARVKFEQQNVASTGDFRLLYTLADGIVGGRIVSYRPSDGRDGFFMLLASPDVRANPKAATTSKTVIFAIDRSGSMAGRKIEQARNAAKFVIANLNPGDLFNIVVYDGRIETFRPELERLTPETRAEALAYVSNLRAGGLTDIDGAMTTALAMLEPGAGPTYVLFMTDGQPTAGVTGEMEIAKNAETRNRAQARIFCFGVGHDVNARLLDRISAAHGGTTEYVGPDDDLEVAVGRFYGKMTAPVMTGIVAAVRNTAINRAYPERLPDLFAGGQIVWVGRYTQSGPAGFTLSGTVGQTPQSMTIETRLAGAGEGQPYAFVERLWAQRRIAAIVSQMDLHGRNPELLDELVDLSRRYGILTPYTSFLADETSAPNPLAAAETFREQVAREAKVMDVTAGEAGFGQRHFNALQANADIAGPQPPGDAGGDPFDGRAVYAVTASNRMRRVESMRQVAGNTFFRRGNQWIHTEAPPEEIDHAETVERFSPHYFALASAPGGHLLAQDGELIVNIGGRVYNIVERE